MRITTLSWGVAVLTLGVIAVAMGFGLQIDPTIAAASVLAATGLVMLLVTVFPVGPTTTPTPELAPEPEPSTTQSVPGGEPPTEVLEPGR